MPTVLILESDPLSRVHYLRALGGLPGTCVVASSSESEAKTLVSAITPDVVVTTSHWLQQDRLDWWPRSSDGPGPSVVAIQEAETGALHTTNARVIACLAKPVDANELRRAVQDQLVKAGPDLWFGLSEYVQLACQGRRSLRLAITSTQGSGVVTIEQGQLWAASFNGTTGFAALARALQCAEAHVALWAPLVCTSAREIAGEWTTLLASAARYVEATEDAEVLQPNERDLDFSDVLVSTMVPVSTVIESGQKLRSGRGGYESLLCDAVAAVLDQRYADALEMFEEACTLAPDSSALQNRVAWLRQLQPASKVSQDAQS